MIIDTLSKEIIKRIFANVGAVSGKMFGRMGLVDSKIKLAKTVTVRYDDVDRQHDVFAGQIIVGQSKLRGLLINLTVDNDAEYLFLFRMDGSPIHALRSVYYNEDDGFFRIFDKESFNNSIFRNKTMR